MIVWCICFSFLVSIVKFLNKDLPRPLLIWIRLFFGICFAIPVIINKKISTPKTKSIKWYIIRTILVYISMSCTYYAYSNLPILTATAIGYTEPMMEVLIAILFLHEKVSIKRWLFIILGYIGVYIAINPRSLGITYLPFFIAVCANIFSSGAKVIAKHLTNYEPIHQMVLYGDILLFMIASFFVIPFFKIPSSTDIKLLLILGLLGYIAKYCYVNAIKIAPMNFVAPITYMRIFISLPIGLYFFHEAPNMLTCIGSIIIIIANYFLIKFSSKSSD